MKVQCFIEFDFCLHFRSLLWWGLILVDTTNRHGPCIGCFPTCWPSHHQELCQKKHPRNMYNTKTEPKNEGFPTKSTISTWINIQTPSNPQSRPLPEALYWGPFVGAFWMILALPRLSKSALRCTGVCNKRRWWWVNIDNWTFERSGGNWWNMFLRFFTAIMGIQPWSSNIKAGNEWTPCGQPQ